MQGRFVGPQGWCTAAHDVWGHQDSPRATSPPSSRQITPHGRRPSQRNVTGVETTTLRPLDVLCLPPIIPGSRTHAAGFVDATGRHRSRAPDRAHERALSRVLCIGTSAQRFARWGARMGASTPAGDQRTNTDRSVKGWAHARPRPVHGVDHQMPSVEMTPVEMEEPRVPGRPS